MNQYGQSAMRHWQINLPHRYAQISDPTCFFTDLGEQLADQIDQMSDQIAGLDPPNEDYLSKLGRLTEARMTATDEVLRQHLPSHDDPIPAM
jgi:hypothetical protein